MAFYGYVLLDLSSKNINKLYVTWRKCIRKFLDIPYQLFLIKLTQDMYHLFLIMMCPLRHSYIRGLLNF